MIARAREREIDLEHLRKRKAETEQVTGVWGRSPWDLTLGRRANGVGAATGYTERPMRGYVDLDHWDATSAARLGTLERIVLPLPPTF